MPQNLGVYRTAYAVVFTLILGVAAVFAAPPIYAAEKNVFHVEGVTVDARAQDELAAKTMGLTAAKQHALQLLLTRLSPLHDHDRLPEADSKAMNELVRDFSLADERFGGGRYLASLTVRFNPPAVRDLLRDHNIPFAETKSLPVLVLPVHQMYGTNLLWDNPNPWFDAWRRVLADDPQRGDGLLPLKLPNKDLSDLTVISAAQAIGGDAKKLNAIAGKYGAAGVLVAAATVLKNQRGAAASVEASLAPYGREQGTPAPSRRFDAFKNETGPDFLTRVARHLFTNAEEDWKNTNLLSESVEQNFTVLATFHSFKEWLTLRRRLDGVAPVRDIDIARLSIHEATLALRFIGELSQLKIAMAQRNLDLSYIQVDDQWTLRLRDGT
jgi:hypothetical protein